MPETVQPNDPTPVPPSRSKKGGNRPGAPRPGAARPQARKQASGRQARQAAQRRNRNLAIVAVVAVVAIVVVVVAIGLGSNSSSGSAREPAPAAAVEKLANIPMSVLTAAVPIVGSTNLVPNSPAVGGAITKDGKPEILYIGAEFCPYCGAERWAMVIALSKFGTFSGLKQTHSAVDDGNIGTWSFYGATYSSPYLTFTPVENYTNQPSGSFYKLLETPTSAQQALWNDNLDGKESYPFVDFAGKSILTTAQYPITTVEEKSFQTILDSVGSNNNTVGAAIDASAAVMIKHICTDVTGNQPSDVCSAVANVPAPVQASTSTGSSAG